MAMGSRRNSSGVATLSVAMATFNGERFLKQQLESIARQSRWPDEVVISDDGSSDGTLAILQAFAATAPFPVRINQNRQRLGYADNFLHAVSLCRGDLIAFCDQDDVWLEGKLARCLPFFDDAEVMLAVHSGIVVDAELLPSGVRHPRIKRTRVLWDRDLFRETPPGFAMIIRKGIPGLFHTPRAPNLSDGLPMPHDTWAAILAGVFGKVAFIEEPLIYYRRHQTTTTTLVSLSTPQKVQHASRSTAQAYERVALWSSQLQDSLEQLSLSGASQATLRNAGLQCLRRRQEAFGRRATLYAAEQGFGDRLAVFVLLLLKGFYGRRELGNLGLPSLLKDGLQVCSASN